MIEKIYIDKEGRRHTEYYNKKGKLVKTVLETSEDWMWYDDALSVKGWTKKETRDSKGRLLKMEIGTPDKDVDIKFFNGIIAKLFGIRSIAYSFPDSNRQDVNSNLRKVNKDKYLSSEEKQVEKRRIIAEYRDSSFKTAPIQKVDFALATRYLMPRGKQR